MVQLYWTGCLPLTIHKRYPTTAEHEVFDLLAFAPQPVQPSLDALEGEIHQLPPCRCQASCGRSINIEQRQTGLPPASHSHNPTPEVAPVTERRHAFQSMINVQQTVISIETI